MPLPYIHPKEIPGPCGPGIDVFYEKKLRFYNKCWGQAMSLAPLL